MRNEFDIRMKKAKQEVLELKTASEYTSVKSAEYYVSGNVSTGIYRITYGDGLVSKIVAQVFVDIPSGEVKSLPGVRTPSGNTQDVEVSTNRANGTTYTTTMRIMANRPIVSVVKIS